jgi:hypothetical protein
MSRLTQRLLCLPVLLLTAAAGRAQPPANAGADNPDPLDDLRVIAKAKYEATHRTPEERARIRLEAAGLEVADRFQEYASGKTILDLLLPSSGAWLEAGLAALPQGADPTPLFEDHWRQALECEKISLAKFQAGKIGVSDLAEVRWTRLRAEAAWVRSRAEHAKSAPPSWFALPVQGLPRADAEEQLERLSRSAKEKFEAVHTSPTDRAVAERAAAEEMYRSRRQEWESGKTTLDLFQEAALRLLETELSALDKDADPTPYLRRYFESTRESEAISAAKLQAWKIGTADFLSSQYPRLQAEAALLRARERQAKPARPSQPVAEQSQDDALEPGRAKALFTAFHADRKELESQMFAIAREIYQERSREFMAGKTTLSLVLESSALLLEAERAAHPDKAGRAAAAEAHWRRILAVEAVTETKLSEGRVAVSDFMQVRYARLRAESLWLDGDGK